VLQHVEGLQRGVLCCNLLLLLRQLLLLLRQLLFQLPSLLLLLRQLLFQLPRLPLLLRQLLVCGGDSCCKLFDLRICLQALASPIYPI
jgi:hypothetical protein